MAAAVAASGTGPLLFRPPRWGLSLLIGHSPREALLPVSAPRARRGSKVGFVLTRSWHRGARCGFSELVLRVRAPPARPLLLPVTEST